MIKRFLGYYKKHLGLFTLDMIAAVIISVCTLVYPTVAKKIINEYVYEKTPKMLLLSAALLLGIYILKAVCTYIVSYHGHVMGIRMQRDMRQDLFKKYQALPTRFFDNNKTGDLLTRLVNDLFEVSELAHHGPENLFLAVLMFAGSFTMLMMIDIYLTLIVLAIVPFIVLVTVLSRKDMHAAMKSYRKQTSVINSSLENSISGIRETKLFAKSEREIEKFARINNRLATLRSGAMKSLGRYETVMAFISDFLYLTDFSSSIKE